MSRRSRLLPVLALLASLVPALVIAEPAAAAPPPLSWEVLDDGWDRASSPAIADVDGNGINDVVVGHQDGWVRIFKDGTNQYMRGWPQPAVIAGNAPTAIEASPTVADLDKDGRNEIIQGTGSTFVANQHGGIVVFNADGSTRCRWAGVDNMRVWGMNPYPDGWAEGVFSTPAIGDVDGDGYNDIVFGGWDAYIHVLNRHCQEVVPRFFNDDTVWSSPALYDVDGDGRQEIFIGGDSHSGGSEDWPGGIIRALDWRPGGLVQLWERKPGEVVHSSVAIGDINGDGRKEAIHGAGDFYLGRRGTNPDSFKVYAWHVDDGSNVPGWPVSTGGVTWSSPSLADLTGDGVPEVIQGSRDHHVYAFRGNGSLLWKRNPTRPGDASFPVQSSAMVGDINADAKPEVVIGTGFAMYVMDGATGATRDALYTHWSHETTAAMANFGPNGWKIVTAGFDTPNRRTRYAAYRIPAPKAEPQWPQWRKNARKLGTGPTDGTPLPAGYCGKSTIPTPTPSSSSAKGYWILGRDGGVITYGGAQYHGSLPGIGVRTTAVNLWPTKGGLGYWIMGADGGVFSFGNAKFHGSMGGKPLNGPIIGMTPTPDGGGYWLLGSDGGIFSFGNAKFWGSMGGRRLNAPIIAMASTPTGNGYWLLGADGGIFTFGDAKFHGSTGGMKLNAPVISMSPTPYGGYWLLGGDGGIFSFGPGAGFYGSIPGSGLCQPPAGQQLRGSSTSKGYWILTKDGQVWSFGDAKWYGGPGYMSAADLAILR